LALEVVESIRPQVPDLRVTVVDITEVPATAVKYGVTTVPAIAINGALAFRGVPGAEALRARVLTHRRSLPG